MSKIEVNAIEPQCGTNLTVGASGDTITFPSGTTVVNNGSQTGFGRTGTVDWQTGDIKTATFTAADGEGYFCNTTSSAFTVNLPVGSAGAIVSINDYANTAATNNITIAANGSEKIQGSTTDHVISTNGVTITLVYVDGTQGWKLVDTGEASSLPEQALFTVATGGTITCCGDYKIHTFTGPGTFCVSQIGNSPTNPTGGPTTVSYMVVAGGGGQSNPGHYNGGGGAGGFREGRDIAPSYTASPLVAPGLTISATSFPITVGAGGGATGGNSIFSTITSTGGGGGGSPGLAGGTAGGSGGGGSPFTPASDRPGASGNTPPVSPPQGNPGGTGKVANPPTAAASGGGGGATQTGQNAGPFSYQAGDGGNGATTSISGSSTAYAGGGGGATYNGADPTGGSGGTGGGGDGGKYPNNPASTNGTANTGGGAGGDAGFTNPTGGSGIVIIRYKFQ
jgi:hypothetical protein